MLILRITKKRRHLGQSQMAPFLRYASQCFYLMVRIAFCDVIEYAALMLPVVAIIGRPNVGKSTLFNRLVGRRQAIVNDFPGVTRDRLYGECHWRGRDVMLVDTGGIIVGGDALDSKVSEQSLVALEQADVVVFVLDGRLGLHPMDEDIMRHMHRSETPVVCVINKCEDDLSEEEFYGLGITDFVQISAEHGRGIDGVLDAVHDVLPAEQEVTEADPDALRVAIIGRPNVGKSTFVNTMAGAERVVAHNMPGTTRDVIDVMVEREGKRMLLLDTAGIRRKSKTTEALEKFSVIKSLRSIARADVVIFMLDVEIGVSHYEHSLISEALTHGRPTILVLNKCDMVPGQHDEHMAKAREVLGDHARLPMTCISAKEATGLHTLWKMLFDYAEATKQRLSTSALNRLLETVQNNHHIPSYRGHRVKLFYVTQTGIKPPKLTCFTNFPEAIPDSYKRYVTKHLEAAFNMPGLPIRLQFRKKANKYVPQ